MLEKGGQGKHFRQRAAQGKVLNWDKEAILFVCVCFCLFVFFFFKSGRRLTWLKNRKFRDWDEAFTFPTFYNEKSVKEFK